MDQFREEIKNWDEIVAYREAAARKSDFERTELAKEKTGVEMPVCRCAYDVLYGGQTVRSVLERLMRRDKRHEADESWI